MKCFKKILFDSYFCEVNNTGDNIQKYAEDFS